MLEMLLITLSFQSIFPAASQDSRDEAVSVRHSPPVTYHAIRPHRKIIAAQVYAQHISLSSFQALRRQLRREERAR